MLRDPKFSTLFQEWLPLSMHCCCFLQPQFNFDIACRCNVVASLCRCRHAVQHRQRPCHAAHRLGLRVGACPSLIPPFERCSQSCNSYILPACFEPAVSKDDFTDRTAIRDRRVNTAIRRAASMDHLKSTACLFPSQRPAATRVQAPPKNN